MGIFTKYLCIYKQSIHGSTYFQSIYKVIIFYAVINFYAKLFLAIDPYWDV